MHDSLRRITWWFFHSIQHTDMKIKVSSADVSTKTVDNERKIFGNCEKLWLLLPSADLVLSVAGTTVFLLFRWKRMFIWLYLWEMDIYKIYIPALSPAFLTCVTSTIASWLPSIPNYPWTKLRNWGESNHFVQLSCKKEGLFSIKDGFFTPMFICLEFSCQAFMT